MIVSPKASRVALVLGAFLAGLLLFFGVIVVVTGIAPSPIGQAVAAVGGPFHLEDQNGKPVSDQDMKGRPFLVFFGFTHCPDVCPTTLFDLSQVLQKLGPDADRTGALFITVDPERDTPAVLKDYLSNFDPHLRGLTGDQASINAAIKAYRVYAKKVPLDNGDYTMDHTAVVYLMDKDGHFVAPFSLKRTPEAAAADLRRYL
ncbi:MAG TPA: SCO family protein [Xanthobacteraceae bacterium]|nr:SCO family protein [Xanthobacteraceae bacterium]